MFKIEDLTKNYSDKNIAVNQDSETKAITFTLVDATIEKEKTEESTEN